MRKIILLFLLIPCFIHGQNNKERVFALKPSLGLNACQVHGDSYSGYNKLGLFGGLAVNAKLSERTSFELGFYFSQKGARHNQNPKIGDYSFYRLNLNYIDLPLSYRRMLNSNYFVTAGLSFAYLISYTENKDNYDISKFNNFNKTEIGLNFGLGRNLKKGYSIEVRSCNSITPIRTYGAVANQVYYNNPIARFFNKGFYNNLISIFISYKFDQRKQRDEP